MIAPVVGVRKHESKNAYSSDIFLYVLIHPRFHITSLCPLFLLFLSYPTFSFLTSFPLYHCVKWFHFFSLIFRRTDQCVEICHSNKKFYLKKFCYDATRAYYGNILYLVGMYLLILNGVQSCILYLVAEVCP
jgi:hypothetical protein